MVTINSPETSVTNKQTTPLCIPKEQRPDKKNPFSAILLFVPAVHLGPVILFVITE